MEVNESNSLEGFKDLFGVQKKLMGLESCGSFIDERG
jgi:hypothetical protein